MQDTTGEELNLATNIFLDSATGNRLKEKVLSVYKYSSSVLSTSPQKNSFDNLFSTAGELKTHAEWEQKYFENTTTSAALAMLSRFQNDCINAAFFSLSIIKEKIEN